MADVTVSAAIDTFMTGGVLTCPGFTTTSTGIFTSAATSGLQVFNTADQVTAYQRGILRYTSNVLNIGTEFGTGSSATGMTFGVGASATGVLTAGRVFQIQSGAPFFTWNVGATGTTGAWYTINGTSSAITGPNTFLSVLPIYNQASGTGANTDFKVNRTETAIMSGAQLLADFQVATVSKFSISNAGVPATNGTPGISTTVTTANLVGKTLTITNGLITAYS